MQAHFSTLINAYPEFMAAAVDDHNNSFLCLVDPSKEATFTFLKGVWAYIVSVFPDAQVHIGGDEFWPGCWTQSAEVSAWMIAQNYSVSDAYYYYERRIIGIARELNRNILAWQDIQGYNGTATSLDVALDVSLCSVGGAAGRC
jgi:hexosaminidase